MDPVYEAALRAELAMVEQSPDREARTRRMAEIRAQLGSEPAAEDTAASAPLEIAVTPRRAPGRPRKAR